MLCVNHEQESSLLAHLLQEHAGAPEPQAAVHPSPELNHLAALWAKLEYCFHVQSSHCSCVHAFSHLRGARSKSAHGARFPCHLITAQILGCQSASLYAALLPLPAYEHPRRGPFPPHAAHLLSTLIIPEILSPPSKTHAFFLILKAIPGSDIPQADIRTPSFHIFSKRRLHMSVLTSLLTPVQSGFLPYFMFFFLIERQ